MSEIYIHVGLHKTATTFLQKEIFPKLEGIKYYNLLESKNRQLLLALAKEDGKILISDEDLSGSPWIFEAGYNASLRYKILYTLHDLFPDAKIIVGVREKSSWLKSVYKQARKMNPFITSNTFEKSFDNRYLDFETYINTIKLLWGEDNVYVYKYEDLLTNPQKFVEGLCNFMKLSPPNFVNRRHNQAINRRQERLLNFLYKTAKFLYLPIRKILEG